MKILLLLLAINSTFVNPMKNNPAEDVFDAGDGKLSIFFIGHGTLMFEYNGMVIHIDPTMRESDYSKMPDADLILVTHHHGDARCRFDPGYASPWRSPGPDSDQSYHQRGLSRCNDTLMP
jgi:hypothetical protein